MSSDFLGLRIEQFCRILLKIIKKGLTTSSTSPDVGTSMEFLIDIGYEPFSLGYINESLHAKGTEYDLYDGRFSQLKYLKWSM